MSDERKTSPPSSSGSPSALPSQDALDSRSVVALTRALEGNNQRLDDIKTAMRSYETTYRFRDGVLSRSISLQADELSKLTGRIDTVVEAVRFRAGVSAAEREALGAATQQLVRAAEETGQHMLLAREPEDGPAPKAVTRAVSRYSVKLAHLLWPHAQVSATRVVVWGVAAATGAIGGVLAAIQAYLSN